jgi:alpha-mannosidase
MNDLKLFLIFFLSLVFLLEAEPVTAQKSWFADGYHGGIHGHYPMWQARFMVEKLKEHPDWKINLEIEPETWDSVSVKDPENFKAFQEYFETEGRFGRIEFVNPAWAQPFSYNISGESIIRQFSYGIAKTKKYFPKATFLTYSAEEPCFTSSLPQILKGFGFKYAVLRNPNTCWGGYTSGFGKDLVNWIGPDGTSMPAVPRYACEELSDESTWQTASWTNSIEFIETCFDNGIKYPVGMTFQDAGWDGGPWGNEYQPTEYTTWTDYIRMVKDKVEADDWNFSQEDVKPGLVWGAQVLQKIAQEVRLNENRLIMAEKMAAYDYLLNGKTWPAEDFAEAWRTLMLAQHHDCWIVPYNGDPGDTWADKVNRWTNASLEISNEKIDQVFDSWQSGNSKIIRVFNTLGENRTGFAAVTLPQNLNHKVWGVYNKKGQRVPAQLSTQNNGEVVLYFEATVPGMGYSSFQLKEARTQVLNESFSKLPDGKIRIETGFYIAILDPVKGGTITSLVDKRSDYRELVEDEKSLNNLRGYFFHDEQFQQGSDLQAKVNVVEDGELFIKVKVENEIAGNEYKQVIFFAKNSPRIDFELFIDWNGQPGIGEFDNSKNYNARDRRKAFYNDGYKLHLQFPFKNLGGKLFKNAPFDVCESRLDNTLYSSWDSIKHNVILNWVDVANADNDYGVALFTDHTTSYLQTEELSLGLTVQYVGKALWGRDYRIHGPTHIRYALLPHSGNWEQASVESASLAWNEPLTGRFVSHDAGPGQWSLLELNDDKLQISSLAMDGKDLIIRIYNSSSEINHKIQWNCKTERMALVDLNGDEISSVKTEKKRDGRLLTNLQIPQFGFRTIKLSNIQINKQN